MLNEQLLNYVRQQLKIGSSKEVITNNLKTQGWTDLDITQVFAAIIPTVDPLTQNNTQPQVVEQKDLQFIQNSKEPTVLSTHKSKKIILLALSIFIFLCLIGGGVYAYYSGLFLSLPALTSKAIYNIKNINSTTYDTTIKVDFSEIKDMTNSASQLLPGDVIPTEFSLTTKGSYDFSDENNRKISSLFSIDSGLFSGGIELRMIKDTIYGKLVKAPVISIFSMITKYENKWFSFPLKSENSENLNTTFNPIIEMAGIDPEIINKITPDQKEQLYKITRDSHLVKIVEKLSPESINGKLSYHFTFDLDRQGIIDYLGSIKEYVNSIGKNDSALSSFDPTSFSKSLDNLENFKGEIWIGRKDTLPYKIIISFTVKPDKDKDEKIKINIVNIFKDWNKPVSIIVPEESSSFEELISGIMGGAMIEEASPVAAASSSLLNIRVYGEIFYDNHNSYSGFCLSSELKNSQKEIEDRGGSELVCKDSKMAYAVGAKLPEGLSYFCVDSTGFGENTTKLPINTICPQ